VNEWTVDDLLSRLRDVNWERSYEVTVTRAEVEEAEKRSLWDGIAGKFTPSGSFSIGGPKEVGYAVAEALEDRERWACRSAGVGSGNTAGRAGDLLLTMEVLRRYWRARPGTRDHVLLQIVPSGRGWRARACPRVHRLMYPSRTRDALSICETGNGPDCASLASPIVAARTRGDEVRARVAELGRRPPGDLATMSRTTKKVLFPASSLWSARPPRPHVADRSHQRLPTTSSTRSASSRSGWRACARPTR
jgi:hypothetical protein